MAKPTMASELISIDRFVQEMQKSQSVEVPYLAPTPQTSPSISNKLYPSETVPEKAKHITFRLSHVEIKGMSVFKADEIQKLFEPYKGRVVTLDILWLLADKITRKYREAGYFLSQVTVPDQEIENGSIRFIAHERGIDTIEMDSSVSNDAYVLSFLEELKEKRPLKIQDLEEAMVTLNDSFGIKLSATLLPSQEKKKEAGICLHLKEEKQPFMQTQLQVNNSASRFLGPTQISAKTLFTLSEEHQTSLFVNAGIPASHFYSLGFNHSYNIMPKGTLDAFFSYVSVKPGDTLKDYEIEGSSLLFETSFSYKIVNQRSEKLTLFSKLSFRNSDNDIIGYSLTRDHIRTVRLGATYQKADTLYGTSIYQLTYSHGLDILGASQKYETYTSQEGASPDFYKVEISASRLQTITDAWQAYLLLKGQYASNPLHSAEQFSYGGDTMGAAYDYGEISGDSGIATSIGLHYKGIPNYNNIKFVPFAFYDVGAVWRNASSSDVFDSGSSAGFGLSLNTSNGVTGNLLAAFPLTHRQNNPVSGNSKTPRYKFSLSYKF